MVKASELAFSQRLFCRYFRCVLFFFFFFNDDKLLASLMTCGHRSVGLGKMNVIVNIMHSDCSIREITDAVSLQKPCCWCFLFLSTGCGVTVM